MYIIRVAIALLSLVEFSFAAPTGEPRKRQRGDSNGAPASKCARAEPPVGSPDECNETVDPQSGSNEKRNDLASALERERGKRPGDHCITASGCKLPRLGPGSRRSKDRNEVVEPVVVRDEQPFCSLNAPEESEDHSLLRSNVIALEDPLQGKPKAAIPISQIPRPVEKTAPDSHEDYSEEMPHPGMRDVQMPPVVDRPSIDLSSIDPPWQIERRLSRIDRWRMQSQVRNRSHELHQRRPSRGRDSWSGRRYQGIARSASAPYNEEPGESGVRRASESGEACVGAPSDSLRQEFSKASKTTDRESPERTVRMEVLDNGGARERQLQQLGKDANARSQAPCSSWRSEPRYCDSESDSSVSNASSDGGHYEFPPQRDGPDPTWYQDFDELTLGDADYDFEDIEVVDVADDPI